MLDTKKEFDFILKKHMKESNKIENLIWKSKNKRKIIKLPYYNKTNGCIDCELFSYKITPLCNHCREIPMFITPVRFYVERDNSKEV